MFFDHFLRGPGQLRDPGQLRVWTASLTSQRELGRPAWRIHSSSPGQTIYTNSLTTAIRRLLLVHMNERLLDTLTIAIKSQPKLIILGRSSPNEDTL